jgi:hypothetical protein
VELPFTGVLRNSCFWVAWLLSISITCETIFHY